MIAIPDTDTVQRAFTIHSFTGDKICSRRASTISNNEEYVAATKFWTWPLLSDSLLVYFDAFLKVDLDVVVCTGQVGSAPRLLIEAGAKVDGASAMSTRLHAKATSLASPIGDFCAPLRLVLTGTAKFLT